MDQVQYFGVGRRKKSVARVILTSGTGKIMINNREFEDYLPSAITRYDVLQPLELTKTRNQFDLVVNVNGGGKTGQAGAIRLGISRALTEINPDFRQALKREGFMTRDDRAKERHKYGRRKARKSGQFSKR